MSREADVSGGGGSGKANFQELTITKRLDKSSPILMEACATGKTTPKLILSLTRSGGSDGGETEYLVIRMEDVLVTSVSTGGSSDADRPIEQFSLNFTRVEFSYTPIDETGRPEEPVVFVWDLAANTEG